MKKNIILLIVSLAMFMESIDTTIINTAIPMIAHSLNTSPINLKLALISYLLSLAIFIPISGWIADRFGVKKVFITAVFLFSLSSLWCGFANNLSQLVIARVVQGIGGSLTLPLGRLIILRTSERHEILSKMSVVIMIAALGMMLGPLLGGIITHNFSWPWIFWVNVPVGALTVFLTIKLLPEMPPRPVPKLDKRGFVLFGIGLASLTLGFATLSESAILLAASATLISLATLFLTLYVKHSKNKTNPVVNIKLLKTRTFRVGVVGNLLIRLGFGGVPFLIPLLLQIGLGFSPELSGFLLTPTALGVLMIKPLSLHIIRFLGYKKLLIINTFLISLTIMLFATITIHTPIFVIGVFTFAYGFFIALQYSGMNSLAYANIGSDDIAAASSIMSTVQQVAQSFGVATAAIMLRMFSTDHLLSMPTFHHTFIGVAILTLASIFIFLQLKRDDGHELVQVMG